MSTRIENPIARGDRIIIPAGTVIRTTHPRRGPVRVSKRKSEVLVRISSPGWIDTDRNKEGRVNFPTISWAGEAQYLCDVQVTPELCEANGIPVPELPELNERGLLAGRYRMEVIPSYADGYTNRWAAP